MKQNRKFPSGFLDYHESVTTPCSAYGNESYCRSRGHEFDPSPVPYFCGDWSWNNFYGHSPPYADSRRVVSYKGKYVHKVLVKCLVKPAQEKVWLCELTVPTWHDLSCWLRRKESNQPWESQTVWTQIKPNKSLGLIWVQTVCHGYRLTTLNLDLLMIMAVFSYLGTHRLKTDTIYSG